MNTHKDISIVLATVNARYTHTAFGLRWIYANMGPLQAVTRVQEFVLGQPPLEIVEAILAANPHIVGLGVYIWNIGVLTQVAEVLKALRPDIILVVGGPEISYEYEKERLFHVADYLVQGEGEQVFPAMAHRLLNGETLRGKVVTSEPLDVNALAFPYDTYGEEDLAQRIIYVESSRGCPFRCAFCLSSRDSQVREFDIERLFPAFDRLLERGARRFTFVDRTFNLFPARSECILRFFRERWREGMQLHLEILPDRLTESTIEVLSGFPPGGLYLEAGIQTTTPAALEAIERYQDVNKGLENLRAVRERTCAEVHVDLVAGLPYETLETFLCALDNVLALQPAVIQLGILKRLKGTAITKYGESGAIVFAPYPPYEVLETTWISFEEMQRLKRLARYLEIFYNSHYFPASLKLLERAGNSPAKAYVSFADFLWSAARRTHELSLASRAGYLYQFLVAHRVDAPEVLAQTIQEDYHRRPGRKERLPLPESQAS
ncbi:MAG TPA: DUF4080 domain-containing protein [Candidatus Hydrogenedentes bacterium]|nr:DUF4080 domain-containing protein [Candidatus Hydrogenedentota bacterium]HOL78157.1 DUF4080 domain-containing protein [Candidatus Hydrogenedentota bacterium]HPO87244.1 DUF4080 domain-containing protein [Candidatus Hydrogenedentota bacterium]